MKSYEATRYPPWIWLAMRKHQKGTINLKRISPEFGQPCSLFLAHLQLLAHENKQLSSIIINYTEQFIKYHQLFINYHQLFIRYSSITQIFRARSPHFSAPLMPAMASMKARMGAMPVPSATISMGVLCFSGKVTFQGKPRGGTDLGWSWESWAELWAECWMIVGW